MSANVSGERNVSVFAICCAVDNAESCPATITPKFVAEPAAAAVAGPVPL